MTKDEALKLALEALENISTALREDDVLGSDSELMLNAITAIKEALDECDEDELIIRYHEMTIKRLEKRIEELTAQPAQDDRQLQIAMRQWDDWKTYALELEGEVIGYKQILDAQPERGSVAWEQFHEHLVERNFCPRCGKRTADLTTIHTCTPPQENT